MRDTDSLDVEFRDLFMLYDRDNNGFLSKSEFTSIMKSIGVKITDSDINEMIKDHVEENGELSKESFIEILNNKMKSVNTQNELIEAFKIFDRENAGYIAVADMKSIFKMFNTLLTENEIAKFLDTAQSVNNDGNIYYDQFSRMILERN